MSDTVVGMTDIGAIRKYDGILYVRNNTAMTITLNTSEELFYITPKGTEEDCKILPKGSAMLSGFHRLLMRGSLTVSPDLEEFATEGALAAEAQRQSRLDAMTDALEPPSTDVDMVEKTCLISGKRVFQTRKDIKNLVPPLADEYKGREHEFVPVEKPDGSVDFHRATVTKE